MSTTQSEPDQDKARPRDPAPVFLDARREFAERFLAGEGLEIGALHLPLETPRRGPRQVRGPDVGRGPARRVRRSWRSGT